MILARNISKGSFGVPGVGVVGPGEEVQVDVAAAKFCSERREFLVTFPDMDDLAYKEDGKVKYVGFTGAIDSRFGYGSAAITILQAMTYAGLEASCKMQAYTPDLPPDAACQMQRREWIPKVEIVHSTPDWFFFADSPITVAWTMWETDRIPNTDDGPYGGNWVEKLNQMDAVLVPCQWNKDVFENSGVHTPITVIPYAVDDTPWPFFERPERETFQVFLFGDLSTRKAPLEAVEAFQRAFPTEMNCKLILKTFAGRFANGGMAYAPSFTDPRIELIDEVWSRTKLLETMQQSDCGIWLSRGEGFGLPPVQMAMTGLPVVMTTHSGMAEYYDPKFFYGVGIDSYSRAPLGGNWANPNVEEAAAQLRKVYDDRKAALKRGKAASTFLRKRLSLPVMAGRLEHFLGGF